MVTNAITGKTQSYLFSDLGDPSRPTNIWIYSMTWSMFRQTLEKDLGMNTGEECFAEVNGGQHITDDRHLRGAIYHACMLNEKKYLIHD